MTETGKSLRYERKFFIEDFLPVQAIALVKQHPAMFRELYPPRYINNFYFDTPGLQYYNANVDGDAVRAKVRLRWYHNLLRPVADGTLEVKFKDGIVGDKWSYPFPAFNLHRHFHANELLPLIRHCDLPADLRAALHGMEISLLNRYYRYYFATPDGRFRVTVDTQLTFYHVDRFNNHFPRPLIDHRNVIVELKYEPQYDPEAQRIAAWFPFRMTRSSKYVNGIELVYL